MAESSAELTKWHPDSGNMRPPTGIEGKFFSDGKKSDKHIYRPGSIPPPSSDVRNKEDTGIDTVWKKATSSPLLEREIPRRPDYGDGQPTVLYTNHFDLDAAKAKLIYKYHVIIGDLVNLRDGKKRKAESTAPTQSGSTGLTQAPTGSGVSQPDARQNDKKSDPSQEKPQHGLIRKKRRLFEILLQHPVLKAAGEAVVTDYADFVFTTKELDLSKQVSVFYSAEQGGRPSTEEIEVKIKLGKRLDVGSLTDYLRSPFTAQKVPADKEIIQALNIIMKHSPSMNSHISVGTDNSKFHLTSGESEELRRCVVALKGYYASMRTSTARLLLNLNVCTSAFYQEGRVDVIMRHLGGNPNSAATEAFLKKRRVSTHHLKSKRFKIIYGFLPRQDANDTYHNAQTFKFTPPDEIFEGRAVTVEEYFARKHEKKLKYPELPLLSFGVLKDKPAETTATTGTSMSQTQKTDAKKAELSSTLPIPRQKPAEPTGSSSARTTVQQKDTVAVKSLSTYSESQLREARAGKAPVTHSDTQKVNQGKAEPSGTRSVVDQKNRGAEVTPADEKRYELVPPELCYLIPGQIYGKKLDGGETKKMLGFAARPPAENARRIAEAAKDVFDLTSNNPKLDAFGLRVSSNLITVEGRSLTAPCPIYAEGALSDVNLGSWNLVEGEKLKQNAKIKENEWSCLYEGRNGQAPLDRISELLDGHFARCGLTLQGANRKPITVNYFTGRDPTQVDKSIRDALNALNKVKKGVKILFVLLYSKDAHVYSRLKYICEVEFGFHTVCTTQPKFNDKWPASKSKDKQQDGTYGTNLALKFNLKMKGINHTLDGVVSKQLINTMVIGIDVSHPSGTKLRNPKSIAGVVANTADGDFSQWPCSLRTQKGGQEMVEDLKEMVMERLNFWANKANGSHPKKIIIYRDGVSEDQYDEVFQFEMVRIRKALKLIYGKNPHPEIALVIVAKRHHVRFFPTKHKDTDTASKPKRLGNPLPGTVVDRGVTMETGWDFYLQAHDCIQGTAKPAHYVVLHSDFDKEFLNASKLQEITHEFSYLFGRATKAISICAPAYYAHLACERGKVYLHQYYHNPEPTPDGKNPEWDPKGNQWKRTICENETVKGNVITKKNPLADDMFYI